MKRLSVILLMASVACNYNKENHSVKKFSVMFPFGKDTLDWKKIEKENDALKNEFIKFCPEEFKNEYDTYNDIQNHFHKLDDMKKDLHVYDLNDDGTDDLVFTGLSGGEPREVAFILKTHGKFKVVFKAEQEIRNFKFDGHKISDVYLYDDGCCAAYIGFNKIYHADYGADLPKFDLTYISANFNKCYFPDSYLAEPVDFEVVNNHYKLRYTPAVDDTVTVYIDGEPRHGNTIGLIKKGSKGRAIAKKDDKTGRTWWLVEMDPMSKIDSSIFYEAEDIKKVSSKMGWISSRYVKVLK